MPHPHEPGPQSSATAAKALAIEQLGELESNDTASAGELVPLLLKLAGLYEESGEYDAALAACTRAADLAAAAPAGATRNDLGARSLAALIRAYRNRGELARAAALRTNAQAFGGHASQSVLAEVLIELGRANHDLGDHDTAQLQLQRALDIADAVVDAQRSAELRADVLEALGALARARGRYPEADQLLLDALELAERIYGPQSLQVAGVLNELGMVCKFSGRFADGRRYYDRTLAILTSRIGPEAPDVAAVYHNIGGLEHARGDFAAAEPYARAAVTLRERSLGPEHIAVAADKAAHAAILDALGQHDRAAIAFREAIDTFERFLGPDHHDVAVNQNNLAAVVQRQGRLDEAEQLYERALAAKERTLGPDHPETALTLNNLAVNYKRQGRHEDAERTFKRALELLDAQLQPDHPAIRACLRNYAQLLHAVHRDDEAATLEARSPHDRRARPSS
jgi:tetratricopeptide (TPR) repeat protein